MWGVKIAGLLRWANAKKERVMKQTRFYSLFEKREGKWVRISERALTLNYARQVWQSALLAHVLEGTAERRLMPIKPSK